MKLSAAFIIDQLEKTYKVSKSTSISKEPCLIDATLYTPGMKLHDFTVYVVKKEELNSLREYKKLPENCLFVIVGNSNTSTPNVCILEDGENQLEVFSHIQEIFNTYNTWQDDLI